ncbi:MAG: MFS transporter [Pseudomonadales bacterium]|nr:MFS transporter [Pseudomonadales bacterium]
MSLLQVRQHILEGPMRPLQWQVVAIGVLVNMLDGFDLLAASLIAPIITREWGLQPEALGMLLSASLLGTSIGAFVLSPLADVLGRRTSIMLNLGLMAVGMMLSARAESIWMLTVLRVLTGMGVGAMASAVGTLVFEYSSKNTRELGLGLVTIGYNVGVVLGTLFAAWFLGRYSWPAIFVLGGVLTLLLIPVVYFLLPESLDYLVARPKANSLMQINKVLKRLAIPLLTTMPTPSVRAQQGGLMDLLRQPILPRTLMMGLSYCLYMMSSYFFLSWANQLTVDAGFADAVGLSVSRLTNIGGIAGGIIIGLICYKMAFRAISTAILILMGVFIMIFGRVAGNIMFVEVVSFLIGFGIFGAAVVLYSTAAKTFPARVRATGVGISMGAGRFGAFVGPLMAGYLLGADLGRALTCLIMAVPVIIAAFTLLRVPLTPIDGEV